MVINLFIGSCWVEVFVGNLLVFVDVRDVEGKVLIVVVDVVCDFVLLW